MARYIDADLLISNLSAGCMPIHEKGISGILGDEDCIKDYIDNAPTVDLRPERHGRWIKDGSGVIICSECGEEHEWQDYRATYCDVCGALMNGNGGGEE